MSFSFGTPKTASGFTLPATNTPTTSTTGFQINTGAGDNKTPQAKPAATLFSTPTTGFGASPAKTAAQPLSFGTPTTSSFSLTAPVASSAPPAFGLSTSTAASTFTPIIGSTTTSSAGGLTLGSTATASTAPKLTFGSTATTSATPALSLGSTSTTVPVSSSTTAALTIPSSGALTFCQLEDSINKWTIDLEEQGKFFINQAKQLNAWDSLLISNGEKILNLNGSIERVKQQQTQLDQELDFVLAQQKELEELITPLEKELMEMPVSDIDRNQMYQLSEIIDSQLKQMSDDLKEIIEHINESHKDEELSNPITQISRILNAHMNSLQWIDTNTAQISTHLEQINKMQDLNRRNLSLNHSFKNF